MCNSGLREIVEPTSAPLEHYKDPWLVLKFPEGVPSKDNKATVFTDNSLIRKIMPTSLSFANVLPMARIFYDLNFSEIRQTGISQNVHVFQCSKEPKCLRNVNKQKISLWTERSA